MKNNGLNSSSDLKEEIERVFGVKISSSYIRKIRSIQGFVYRRLKKGPFLSDWDKLRRLIWCLNNKFTDFSRYIFVDETTSKLLDTPYYHHRLKSSAPKPILCSSKIRKKINIWGGISYYGPTEFAVIGINNDIFILKRFFLLGYSSRKLEF